MSMSNQPGTPRDDGEMGGNFLNPFQSESVSISLPVFLFVLLFPFTLWNFSSVIVFKKRKNTAIRNSFVAICNAVLCLTFLLGSKIIVFMDLTKHCAKDC